MAIEGCGIPSICLMENAGKGAAELLRRTYPELLGGKVAILAGRGNNGGDGLVLARHLANWGISVEVYLLAHKDELKGDARKNLEIWLAMGGELREVKATADLKDISAASMVVDAIFGTGLNTEIQGLARDTIDLANALAKKVFAVDIPSGIDATSGKVLGVAIKADMTATFGCAKLGQVIDPGARYVGRLEVIDIGIPRYLFAKAGITTFLLDQEELSDHLLSPRDPAAHKGDFGHLLVLAGSPGKTGAAALVCQGAMRAGAGLVTLGIAESLNPIMEVKLTEAMTYPLPDGGCGHLIPDAWDAIERLMVDKSAIAIGPGISTHPDVEEVMRLLVTHAPSPMVIDADGLTIIAKHPDILKGCQAPLILTPHPGEMGRLLGTTAKEVQADRIAAARRCAHIYGGIVCLKGHRTVIATPAGEVYINPLGNPGMASGGMGDVLTGLIGGLLAQGIPPIEAAKWGVYLHALSGDLASQDVGEIPLVAGDLIEYLPIALAEVRDSAERGDAAHRYRCSRGD